MYVFRLNPRLEPFFKKFGNVAARNQHALVHIEGVLGEPGFVHEIRRGVLVVPARLDVFQNFPVLVLREVRIPEGFEAVKRKLEGAQHKKSGFFPVVGRAVPETHVKALHLAHGPANHVADGVQFGRILMMRHQKFSKYALAVR